MRNRAAAIVAGTGGNKKGSCIGGGGSGAGGGVGGGKTEKKPGTPCEGDGAMAEFIYKVRLRRSGGIPRIEVIVSDAGVYVE